MGAALLLRDAQADVSAAVEIQAKRSDGPGVLVLKTDARMASWRVHGVCPDGADDAQLEAWHEQYCSMVRNVADEHLLLHWHMDRHEVRLYPKRTMPEGYASELDEARRRQIEAAGLWVTDLYLTLVYIPNPGARGRMERGTRTAQDEESDRQALEERAALIERYLAPFGIERLGWRREDGGVYCEQAELLAYLANGYWQKIPALSDCPLHELIGTDRVGFRLGSEVGAIACADRQPVTFAMIGCKGYPHVVPDAEETPDGLVQPPPITVPGMLNVLREYRGEVIVSQSALWLSSQQGGYAITKKVNERAASGEGDAPQTVELGALKHRVQAEQDAIVEHDLAVMVKVHDPARLRAAVGEVRQLLSRARAVTSTYWLGSAAAFWSMQPGNLSRRCRPTKITERNFCALTAPHNWLAGRSDGYHWGEADALLVGRTGEPIWWAPHDGEVGHAFFCGGTGSGKTGLMDWLITQLLPKGLKVVFFDFRQGAETFVLAVDGHYHRMRNGEPTGWNPFAMPATARNVAFLQTLVRRLANKTRPELTVREHNQLDEAVAIVMRDAPHTRRLGRVVQYLDGADAGGVAERLARWVVHPLTGAVGSMAWLFDHDADTLDFSAQVTGFDLTDLLGNDDTRDVATLYLLHQMEQLVMGKQRALLVWDEVQGAITDDEMLRIAKTAHEAFRRADAMIWTATQDPDNVLGTKLGHIIRSQTAQRWFFRNRGAKDEAYGDNGGRGFGLNAAELHAVRTLDVASREVLLQMAAGGSRIVRTRLPDVPQLYVLSSNDKRAALLEQVRAAHGPRYAQWARPFEAERRAKGV